MSLPLCSIRTSTFSRRRFARASLLVALLALAFALGSGTLPIAFPLGSIAIPLLGIARALLGLAGALLRFARALLCLATPLVFHRIECHVAGSFSRSCAASSG